MAGSGIGAFPRVIVLILLIVALAFGGLLWFDFLGFIDAKETVQPVLSLVGMQKRTEIEDIESPVLLEEQRFNKQWEALRLREEELVRWEEALAEQEMEVQQKLESLEEREKALEDKEKSFNARTSLYENKRANMEQIANYLVGMPPRDAVQIMQNMEDQDLIDILRTVERLAQEAGEQSIVSFWFSLMAQDNPERAAALQRKMVKKPSPSLGG